VFSGVEPSGLVNNYQHLKNLLVSTIRTKKVSASINTTQSPCHKKLVKDKLTTSLFVNMGEAAVLRMAVQPTPI
jgi:hypothetical protein